MRPPMRTICSVEESSLLPALPPLERKLLSLEALAAVSNTALRAPLE